MKKAEIAALEELILLTIAVLQDDAYGLSILAEIEKRTNRSRTIGSLHSAFIRLEERDFIKSKEGGATKERGGRRKRYFKLTAKGLKVLAEIRALREGYYSMIPALC
jgi:DNA-binding PadR family transcriptional regulator